MRILTNIFWNHNPSHSNIPSPMQQPHPSFLFLPALHYATYNVHAVNLETKLLSIHLQHLLLLLKWITVVLQHFANFFPVCHKSICFCTSIITTQILHCQSTLLDRLPQEGSVCLHYEHQIELKEPPPAPSGETSVSSLFSWTLRPRGLVYEIFENQIGLMTVYTRWLIQGNQDRLLSWDGNDP